MNNRKAKGIRYTIFSQMYNIPENKTRLEQRTIIKNTFKLPQFRRLYKSAKKNYYKGKFIITYGRS